MLSKRFDTANTVSRIPKDMTRTNSSLLASGQLKGLFMLHSKTHYEQVPMEIVQKILKEQIPLEPAIEQDQEIKKKALDEDPIEEPQQTVTGFCAFSERKS
jgi:predicted type IV restriction endonuclease